MVKDYRKKLNQEWVGQNNLGKRFGISGIAVGKILINAGLKDAVTKEATEKALNEGFAKTTPKHIGTQYFLWNTEKVCALIENEHLPLVNIDYWLEEITASLR